MKIARSIFKACSLVVAYSIPLVGIEIFFQHNQRHLLIGDELLYPFFSYVDGVNSPIKRGLQRPNIKKESPHQFLFEYDDSTPVKYSTFRTDKFGTIKPSDMEAGIAAGKVDTVFCGGSTTEASMVWEGQRPPDVFSELTGSISINASRSGKDIYGCIETIDYILGEFTENKLTFPSRVVIANNVNTLMSYGFSLNEKSPSPQAESQPISLRTRLRQSLPGTYYIAYSIRKSFFNKSKSMRDQAVKLRDCCHGAAFFNRPGGGPIFEWGSEKIKEGYSSYIERSITRLSAVLKKHSYPQNNITIAIEPNSYSLPGVSAIDDARQLLYSSDGRKLSPQESGKIFDSYDRIYQKTFARHGFHIISFPLNSLKSDFFYDAVHVTPEGSRAIASNYASALGKKTK